MASRTGWFSVISIHNFSETLWFITVKFPVWPEAANPVSVKNAINTLKIPKIWDVKSAIKCLKPRKYLRHIKFPFTSVQNQNLYVAASRTCRNQSTERTETNTTPINSIGKTAISFIANCARKSCIPTKVYWITLMWNTPKVASTTASVAPPRITP